MTHLSPAWSDHYVGLPYADRGRDLSGADCWGLACIVYREELGISLPDYLGDYASADEQAEVAALIEGGRTSPLWLPVSGPAIAFDIAVFRRGRLTSHVGIVVRHGWMIHMQGEDCAKIENYRGGAWSQRFQGCFRHVSQAVKHGVQRPVQIVSEARR